MSSNKTAYVYHIDANSSNPQEKTNKSNSSDPNYTNGVHQTNPAWVLTFLPWQVRDTLRTKPSDDLNYTTVSEIPLVVENDCIQLSVSDSKTVLTPSMTATLMNTDVNYETALAPGDFVFVNILNWESHARRVANNARALKSINGIHDGFKGFFKIQSVRKSLQVDTESGTKSYAVKITAFAFTEFNNAIYFNPYLLGSAEQQNLLLYLSNIGKDYLQVSTNKGITDCQDIVQYLIGSFIGSGSGNSKRNTDTISPTTTNIHFLMPKAVGQLLGLPPLVSAKDAYNYLFGIQQYSAQSQSLSSGMNPSNMNGNAINPTNDSRFITLTDPVSGSTVTKPEYWNQTKVWSILNQFTNSPVNELYTCFRVAPNGKIMPTMVFRQIPFSSDNFQSNDGFKITKFMSLPRWEISPALALSFDLGKDEALRYNFVQIYGRAVNAPANNGFDIAYDTAKGNYLYDGDDVQRNGLRPYVITSEFDVLTKGVLKAPGWAKIVGDALIGGHLKMTGTISFIGIPEPIAIGDNLQFDGVVYHIEEISHNASIDAIGFKTFRTNISVTHGMDLANSSNNTVYSEMLYESAYKKRTDDYGHSQILPGVSESQDTYYRNPPGTQSPNLDIPHSPGESFTQPNTGTSITKTTRNQ